MWSLLNSLWRSRGHCPVICTDAALPKLAVCECRQQRTLNDIFNIYLLTKFEGRLQLLHHAGDDILSWLETMTTTALLKLNEKCFDTLC